jgi:predicted cupin superfamily sugar epimerase
MPTVDELIALLHLQPLLPEGGFFRETYRSTDRLPAATLPRFGLEKAVHTAIYYLLTPQTFSALHRLPTDEVFHFYLGDPVLQLHLMPDGGGHIVTLGTDLAAGQRPQVVVPRGVWQGSCLAPGGTLALMGTTMAPGFDFSDYEACERERLLAEYPVHADWIRRLTR